MSVCGHPLAGHGCSRTRSLILHSLGAIPQRTDAVSRDNACCLTQAFRFGELRPSQATGTSGGQQSAPMHSSATRPAVVHGEPGPHHTGKTYPAGREEGRIGPTKQATLCGILYDTKGGCLAPLQCICKSNQLPALHRDRQTDRDRILSRHMRDRHEAVGTGHEQWENFLVLRASCVSLLLSTRRTRTVNHCDKMQRLEPWPRTAGTGCGT